MTPAPATQAPEAPAPSQSGGGQQQGGVVEVKNIEVTIPDDWKVASAQDVLIDVRGAGGQLIFTSGFLKQASTVDAQVQAITDRWKKSQPDTTVCMAPVDWTIDNGPPGKEFQLCGTAKTQSGIEYPAVADYLVAVSADGTTLFQILTYADKKDFNAFSDVAWKKVTPTTVWKLYTAP